MTKRDKTDERSKKMPWISNYPPLQKWLVKHGAICMWQLPQGATREQIDYEDAIPNAYVECWMINRHPFILVIYNNNMGWNIFTADLSIAITETLVDAEKRLGITGGAQ